jgi:glycosyltransferase involved in cell wall biosynthesis
LRVAVDGRYFCSLHRSLALFTRNLLIALDQLDLAAAPTVLIPGDLHPSVGSIRAELGQTVNWVGPSTPINGLGRLGAEMRWVHREIPSLLSSASPAFDALIMPYHHPPIRTAGVHRVVVLHDLCGLGYGFPKWKKNYWRHYLRLRMAAHFADSIWPISEATRDEMCTRFPSSGRNMRPVIYNGLDRKLASSERVQSVLTKLGLQHGSYVVAFSTWQKRKNFDATLGALTLLRRAGRGIRLVGIAPEGESESIAERCVVAGLDDAVILSGISDSDLDALYAAALALVWPSTCEGFGYPVVEAMAQGCPPLVWEVGPGAELVRGAIEPLSSTKPLEIADRIDRLRSLPAREWKRLETNLCSRAADFSSVAYRRQVGAALKDIELRRSQ